MNHTISDNFPFESRFLSVNGSDIHYIDEGKGDPILFLHGNPSSNYLWRNIIPYLTKLGRCIAPDLIGMGKSDKPNINYGFYDSYNYLETFIHRLNLKNITLIVHDWGSGLGFHYTRQHPENVKRIVFMEAVYKLLDLNSKPKKVQAMMTFMKFPITNWILFGIANMFVKKMLPDMMIRKLTTKEFNIYKAPYKTIKSRKPVRVWPQEIAINGKPEYMHKIISEYHEFLKKSQIPKLCLYASPGMLITEDEIPWIERNFPETTCINIGEGLHFIQEDQPDNIGHSISNWLQNI